MEKLYDKTIKRYKEEFLTAKTLFDERWGFTPPMEGITQNWDLNVLPPLAYMSYRNQMIIKATENKPYPLYDKILTVGFYSLATHYSKMSYKRRFARGDGSVTFKMVLDWWEEFKKFSPLKRSLEGQEEFVFDDLLFKFLDVCTPSQIVGMEIEELEMHLRKYFTTRAAIRLAVTLSLVDGLDIGSSAREGIMSAKHRTDDKLEFAKWYMELVHYHECTKLFTYRDFLFHRRRQWSLVHKNNKKLNIAPQGLVIPRRVYEDYNIIRNQVYR